MNTSESTKIAKHYVFSIQISESEYEKYKHDNDVRVHIKVGDNYEYDRTFKEFLTDFFGN